MTRSPARSRASRTAAHRLRRPLLALGVVLSATVGLTAALAATPGADPAGPGADPAGRRPILLRAGQPGVVHGGPADAARARVDTIAVLGGPDRWDGRFELPGGTPSWHGWTHQDASFDPAIHWQVSDHQPLAGQYSLWCGTVFDDGPGYGNSWIQGVRFAHVVTAPGAEVAVRWTGQMRTDTEPAYDFVHLQVNRAGTWETLGSFDGQQTVAIDQTVTLAADELAGEAGDQVQLRVRFESDGAWSDEDGLWPTAGACWLDDLAVRIDDVLVSTTDFEDQEFGDWPPVQPMGVGDFAALYQNLQDVDPCQTNVSTQVAFIDDGVVVPGTGGSECITWCYGPGGYIVNNTGGLLGPDYHLFNRVESPVLVWPAGLEGARLAFDAYRHEDLAFPGSPGIFYTWGVRSTADPVAEPLAEQVYRDRSFVHYGGPGYYRHDEPVGDLLVPGATEVQVCLEVQELGWFWGFDGTDGTPAPYFDNVAVKAWRYGGPQMSARAIDLANDGFPAQGHLDLDDLASNSVRFDMAQTIAYQDDARNDPGDSITVTVAVQRAGAELIREPRMMVRMQANPVFDAVRVLPPNFTQAGAMITGYVEGDTVRVASGAVVEDRWAFDLPDTGFFYPGDVIRFLFEAGDILAADDQWSTLPADTTGFSDLGNGIRWDPRFTVRALPTVHSVQGGQPDLLVWNDAGSTRAQASRWWFALANLGYLPGRDYDLFTTRSPSSMVGNSLSGRATAAVLEEYRGLVYTAGTLRWGLLSGGDALGEPTDDLGLLQDWLAFGDRRLAMMGDNLYGGLVDAGPAGEAFMRNVLGAEFLASDIRPYIFNQVAPLVRAVPGPWPPHHLEEWVAHGGCPAINTFDVVTAVEDAQRVAEFTDPQGNDGVVPYAAMIVRTGGPLDTRAYSLPYDLLVVQSPPGWEGSSYYGVVPARVALLGDILLDMSLGPPGPPVGTPDTPRQLAVRQYPNPFNPRTTIALDLPRTAAVALQIYDLRGKLVRTLVDGRLAAGPHEVVWDGADGSGRPVASGVYFAEVRTGGERRLQKMTLVR